VKRYEHRLFGAFNKISATADAKDGPMPQPMNKKVRAA